MPLKELESIETEDAYTLGLRVLSLRSQGYSWVQIAAQTGLASWGEAKKAGHKLLEQLKDLPPDEVKTETFAILQIVQTRCLRLAESQPIPDAVSCTLYRLAIECASLKLKYAGIRISSPSIEAGPNGIIVQIAAPPLSAASPSNLPPSVIEAIPEATKAWAAQDHARAIEASQPKGSVAIRHSPTPESGAERHTADDSVAKRYSGTPFSEQASSASVLRGTLPTEQES